MAVTMKQFLLLLLVISALSACAPNISPNTYSTAEVGVVSKVMSGTIIAKRRVTIDNNSGVGSVAGATAGAAAGTLVGGNIQTVIIGAVGGAVVGSALGGGLDKSLNQHQADEYIIRLLDHSVISITQSLDINLAVHQKVLIIYGATTRIIPNENQA
jgi:outer membrane lipoprotein SlyB